MKQLVFESIQNKYLLTGKLGLLLSRRWTIENFEREVHKEDMKREPSTQIDGGLRKKRHLHQAFLVEDMKYSVLQFLLDSKYYMNLGLPDRASKEAICHLIRLHFNDFPTRYVLSVDTEDIIDHMLLIESVRKGKGLQVKCQESKSNGFLNITIACRDSPNLYKTITSALEKVASDVLDADVMTSMTGFVRFDIITT